MVTLLCIALCVCVCICIFVCMYMVHMDVETRGQCRVSFSVTFHASVCVCVGKSTRVFLYFPAYFLREALSLNPELSTCARLADCQTTSPPCWDCRCMVLGLPFYGVLAIHTLVFMFTQQEPTYGETQIPYFFSFKARSLSSFSKLAG